ncbi:hypothetical protein [Pacificimonas flava]|uniref:hypothetical protein n=1 Tax=Pacificimonas flava TaxID=1234595 RepID=UPI0004B680D8|nr:hypothetical protein [Pacificimonas flava]MBB5281453.1 hypothetical protein [Pacificimonas flava]
MTFQKILFSAILVALPINEGAAQPMSPQPNAGRADFADLALNATTVARAQIVDAKEVKRERAPGLAPGFRRFLVRAQVQSVLAAPAGVPGEITYLVDIPENERGRTPRMEGQIVLLFLGAEHAPGEFVLAHKYGQQAWSAGREQIVSRFLGERAAAGGAPRAESISSAFHVPGSIPGESETQIFVRTQNGRPLSLVVLRRPGVDPHVVLSTGDIIDPNAPAPDAGSLSSVILACSLPAQLPQDIAGGSNGEALAADYQVALEALGTCDRNF